MKKKLLFVLSLLFISSNVMAGGISVFPQAVDFPANSRKKMQTLNIINNSKTAQTYQVTLYDFEQDDNGRYTSVEQTDNSAKKYLIYSPKRFTLAPGKSQVIRIAKKMMKDAKDGEYISRLKVAEVNVQKPKKSVENSAEGAQKEDDNLEKSVQISTLIAISVPVTIYKGGNLEQRTEILSHQVNNNRLDMVLKRTGKVSSRLKVNVLDAQGEVIGTNKNVRIYMPEGKYNLSINLEGNKKPAKVELIDAVTNKKLMEKVI